MFPRERLQPKKKKKSSFTNRQTVNEAVKGKRKDSELCMAPSNIVSSEGFLQNQISGDQRPIDQLIDPRGRLLGLLWCPVAAWTTTRLICFYRLPPLDQRENPTL